MATTELNPRATHLSFAVLDLPAVIGVIGSLLILSSSANKALFLFFNYKLHCCDSVWSALTLFGDTLVLLPMTLVFLRHARHLFTPMMLTVVIGTILTQGLKHLYDVSRPAALIDASNMYSLGPVLTHNSLPSGHTAAIFGWVAVVLFHVSPVLRKRITLPLLLLACGVGFSRIMVGAHWPADVFLGAAIGWSSAILASRVYGKWAYLRRDSLQQLSIAFFSLSLVVAWFFLKPDHPQVESFYYLVLVFIVALMLLQFVPDYLTQASKHKMKQIITTKSPIKILLQLAFVAALVAAVSLTLGWQKLLEPWRTIPEHLLWLAVALMLVSYAVRSLRFSFYFHRTSTSDLVTFFRLTLIHNLFNNLLPMRSGELSFPVLMKHSFAHGFTASAASLLWLRLLDLMALGFIVVFVFLALMESGWIKFAALLPALTLPLYLHKLLKLGLKKTSGLSQTLARRLDEIESAWPENNRQLWLSWFWTLTNWSVKLSVFAMVFLWFYSIDPLIALSGIVFGEFTSVLPVHSIAGAGSYEAGVLLGLSFFSLDTVSVLSAAINLHLFFIGMTLFSGIIAFAIPKARLDP